MQSLKVRTQSSDEAEAVFYEAFRHGDLAVMSALWAGDDVVCVHPGSGLIRGHEAVIRSWRHIFESGPPTIRDTRTSQFAADGLAVHMVVEEILDEDEVAVAIVLATNVYRRYDYGWLMVEHHGSVVQQDRKGATLQ